MKIPRGEGLGPLYPTIWLSCRLLLGLSMRVVVEGLEHVPRTGPAVLSPNHRSAIDPPLISLVIDRPLYHMAKAELFPYLGWLIRRVGAFPVKRGQGDMRAMRQSIKILREGHLLCVFPEGTRSRTGELGKARPGAAHLARHVGAPVIPAGISGSYGWRRQITVRFGPPVALRGDDGDGERIMDAIRALITPPSPEP